MPSEQLTTAVQMSPQTTHCHKRQRRRRGGTNLANIVATTLEDGEENTHAAASFLIYEHYRNFRHSRSLDIILELDETGEDTDFHHFGMGSGSSLLSSPRYSKSGIKRSQTFSSLSSLVHEAEQDELENHPPTGTNNPDANTCASRQTSHLALKCRPHSTTSGSI